MQTPPKGDALSPRPTDCIWKTRTNEENTADARLVAAYGLGAGPNVVKGRSSPRPEQEQVGGGVRRVPEGRREPHRGRAGRQFTSPGSGNAISSCICKLRFRFRFRQYGGALLAEQ